MGCGGWGGVLEPERVFLKLRWSHHGKVKVHVMKPETDGCWRRWCELLAKSSARLQEGKEGVDRAGALGERAVKKGWVGPGGSSWPLKRWGWEQLWRSGRCLERWPTLSFVS